MINFQKIKQNKVAYFVSIKKLDHSVIRIDQRIEIEILESDRNQENFGIDNDYDYFTSKMHIPVDFYKFYFPIEGVVRKKIF